MTVKELIEKLQRVPEGYLVHINLVYRIDSVNVSNKDRFVNIETDGPSGREKFEVS